MEKKKEIDEIRKDNWEVRRLILSPAQLMRIIADKGACGADSEPVWWVSEIGKWED